MMMTSVIPARAARFVLAIAAAATTLAAAQPALAQTIGVNVGATPQIVVAPSAKVTVPINIDLSNAGASDLASYQATMLWGSARLTFDSIRVVGATGFSLTANTTGAAGGSVPFNAFSAAKLAASGTLANAYFTASATTGGTRLTLTPVAAGSEAGSNILSLLRTRNLDVCVAPAGKWGDVNDDNAVNIIDAQQVARSAVGLSVANPTAVAARGDVTADASVNIIDAQQIARFAVGLSASARVNTALFTPPAVATVAISSLLDATSGNPVNLSAMPIASVGQLNVTAADGSGGSLLGCATFTYTSSNTGVATVSADGRVTAVAGGSTTITVTSGTASASLNLTVAGGGTTGINVSVTSPIGAKRYYVVVDSGPLATPQVSVFNANFARTATLPVILPVGTGYRVRVAAADSLSAGSDSIPTISAGLRVSGVNVSAGSMTAVPVTLTAVGRTGTLPATATAGTPLLFDITFNDPSELAIASTMVLGFGYSTWATDRTSVGAFGYGVTQVISPSSRRYANSIVPAQAGTMFSQEYWTGPLVAGFQFRVTVPSLARGEPLNSTTVAAATSGINVQVTSPVAVGRFFVSVDTGSGQPITATLVGTAMTSGTVTVPAAPRSGYRVRVAAVDSIGNNGALYLVSSMLASGITSGVTVGAGAFTALPITLTATTLTTTTPASVLVNQNITLSGSFTDASRLATSCLMRWSLGTLSSPLAGTPVSCSRGAESPANTWAITGLLPASTSAGTLSARVYAYTTQPLPDGRIIELAVNRSAGNLSVPIINAAATATVNYTSSTPSRFVYAVVQGGALPTVQNADSAAAASLRRAMMRDPSLLHSGEPVRIGGAGEPSTGSNIEAIGVGEVVVVANGNGAGMRSGSIVIPLPAGSNYDIRLVSIDSATWHADSTNPWSKVFGAAGRATGVTVPASGTVTVPITMAAPTVTVVLPDTVNVGALVTGTFTITDPSDIFFGLYQACLYRWSGSTAWTRNSTGTNNGGPCTSTAPSAGMRQWAISFTAPATPGPLFLQFSAEMALRDPATTAFVWMDVYDRNLQIGQSLRVMQVVPVSTGIRIAVTSPVPTSRYVALVDSGGLGAQQGFLFNLGFARSGQLVIPFAAGTGYRVRVLAVDSTAPSPDGSGPTVSAGLSLSSVNVTAGALTDVTMNLGAITGVLTLPAGATTGTPFNATIAVTDPSRVFAANSTVFGAFSYYCGAFTYGTAPFVDRNGATTVSACTRNLTSATTVSFTAAVTAPATPGTIHLQGYVPVSVSVNGATLFYYFAAPGTRRGETLRTIAVSAPSSLLSVTVNTPVAASRFVVVADTTGGLPVVATLAGTAMTTGVVSIPLPSTGTWRVRAVAVDSIGMNGGSILATVRAGGVTTGVVVSGPGTTSATVNASSSIANSFAVPSVVALNGTISISGTVDDPSLLVTFCAYRWILGTLTTPTSGTFNSCSFGPAGASRTLTGTFPAAASTTTGSVQSRGIAYAILTLPDLRLIELDWVSPLRTTNVVQVGSVTVSPLTPTIPVAGSQQMTAVVKDVGNNVVALPVTWISTVPGVATVNAAGLVVGVANGTTYVKAVSSGVADSTLVTVSGGITVGSIEVTLGLSSLSGNATTTATAVVKDPGGTVIPGAVPTWSSTGPRVARVTSGGAVQALGAGSSNITATIGGVSGTASLNVTAATAQFNLEVRYAAAPSTAIQNAFTAAANRWSTIIRGDLPDVAVTGLNIGSCGFSAFSGISLTETIDDLIIYASIEAIDGVGAVLGSAGPCYVRSGGGLSLVGVMRFDSADLDNMVANGTLNAVILHEMGHVLGIGPLWQSKGVLTDPAPSTPDPAGDPIFTGVNAQWAFAQTGMPVYAGRPVPVENCCGSGTRNAHWREAVLARELMTGFVSGGGQPNPLSPLTVTSLIDIGYVVDNAQADGTPWFLRADAVAEPLIEIREGPPPPIMQVDMQGRVVQPQGGNSGASAVVRPPRDN
jgi:hypothetical protein